MKNATSRSEKGQSLFLVTLLLFVFFGLLALALDIGYGYYQRRVAQNAADAGALAAASVYCNIKDTRDPVTVGDQLARDNASQHDVAVVITPTFSSGTVTAKVDITFPTFFGGLFGRPDITALGIAEAGCFIPGAAEGTTVLPVAWACQPPDLGTPTTDSEDCEMIYGDPSWVNYNDNQIYIIMDSRTSSVYCSEDNIPEGEVVTDTVIIDCDSNNDGIDDVEGGGERSWIDLDSDSTNADELKDWMEDGVSETIYTHTWVRAGDGNIASVYLSAATRVGEDVILPVFDYYCKIPDDNSITCPSPFHTGLAPDGRSDFVLGAGQPSSEWFHIVTFAVFHITCVETASGPVAEPGVPTLFGTDKMCPAHYAAWQDKENEPDKDLAKLMIQKNSLTIEGYFRNGYIPGLTGIPAETPPDAGAYTVYLTR